MKKLMPYILSLIAGISPAQPFPLIYGFSVTPHEPVENDQVLIIAEVQTPFQGHRMDRNQQVSHDNFRVDLTACYYSGSTAPSETHIDTFYIGTLKHGYYAVSFKASLSDQPGYCHRTDSTQESTFINVVPSSSVAEEARHSSKVYPNPCTEKLFMVSVRESRFRVRDASGKIVKEGLTSGEIPAISDLAPGVYFLETPLNGKTGWTGFIKQ